MKKSFLFLSIYLIISMVFSSQKIDAQNNSNGPFYYLSPMPGAKMVRPESVIILKTNTDFHQEKISNWISIEGSLSGKMTFNSTVLKDENTIIIQPETDFKFHEKITVNVNDHLFLEPTGRPSVRYSFYTMQQPVQLPDDKLREVPETSGRKSGDGVSRKLIADYDLPEDFPEYEISQKNNPSPGYYFLTPLKWNNGALYIIMMDNYGFPVFYRKTASGNYDFKLQSTGELTYFHSQMGKYVRLNSKMDVTGYYAMANGYTTDLHECNVLSNGHVFMMCYDPQIVDMSVIVEGGQEDAIVTGLVIQEQDPDGNVIFQWRSWDHFEITDASNWVDLTASYIDYVHGNTIEIVSDDEMLISCCYMNEITKINRNTGDIIWRMGGPSCNNNMFTFTNDTLQFRVQHDIRYHGNNLYTLFNNNNGNEPDPWSSVNFYILDEDNFTATEVKRFHNDPPVFGDIMGNAQLLPNGNVVTGWGRPHNNIVTTEFNAEGESEIQITIPHTTYRSFKFEWENDVFTKSIDSLNYEVYEPDSAVQEITIGNNHNRDISLNGMHHHDDAFDVLNDSLLPATLLPGEEVTFRVQFGPTPEGLYPDVLSFYENIENDTLVQRISTQVFLNGESIKEASVDEFGEIEATITPNPGKGFFQIRIASKHLPAKVTVFDGSGNVILKTEQKNKELIPLNLAGFANGLYFVRIEASNQKAVGIQKLIKSLD